MNFRNHRLSALAVLTTSMVAGQALAAQPPNPATQVTPQGTVSSKSSMQLKPPMLTTLVQHPWTDHGGGATTLDVGGNGHCSFTIEGGGLKFTFNSPADVATLPAVVNLHPAPPLGNTQWTAKGIGSCTGTATASTHVEP